MGIEPFLCVGVFVIGILLQCSLAVRDRLLHRFRQGIWMRERLARIAGRHDLLCAGDGAWTGAIGGLRVRLWTTIHGWAVQRWVQKRTGIGWRPSSRGSLRIGEPHVLIVVELPRPAPRGLLLESAQGRGGLDLLDPIADQLVQAAGEDAVAIRALVRDAAVRGPLYEVLGRYPRSVVASDAVYLWIEEPETRLEPLIELASELAVAMAQATPATPTANARNRQAQSVG